MNGTAGPHRLSGHALGRLSHNPYSASWTDAALPGADRRLHRRPTVSSCLGPPDIDEILKDEED